MAVMFAFEVTQDANALVPLIDGVRVAYGFTVLVMPRSILTEKIARRGLPHLPRIRHRPARTAYGREKS